jgi:Histidine kinase-, DNA gyrase B-, and HSP90-like ATPase
MAGGAGGVRAIPPLASTPDVDPPRAAITAQRSTPEAAPCSLPIIRAKVAIRRNPNDFGGRDLLKSGMTPEVLDHAFEPFFTTKEPGHGTGRGLSQVYGFVKQSGGHVKIYSEVGEGTSIKMFSPATLGMGSLRPNMWTSSCGRALL